MAGEGEDGCAPDAGVAMVRRMEKKRVDERAACGERDGCSRLCRALDERQRGGARSIRDCSSARAQI